METQPNQEVPQIPAARLVHGFGRGLANVSRNFIRASKADTYGYLFTTRGSRSPLLYNDDNKDKLERLGKLMLDPTDTDTPNELSTIDSGYTYFGQFVDHDLTLDRDSDIKKVQDARSITNYRTPNLDLDSVYGDGPAIDAFLYNREQLKFIIGLNSSGEFDLPRSRTENDGTATAVIGDPRNDENLFVAQMHLGILKFHNKVVDALKNDDPNKENSAVFQEAQEQVRKHYQWIIVHDYLKAIIGDNLVEDLLKNGPKFFTAEKTGRSSFFMPVEFSVAAYRFGHSMIRDNYTFNSDFGRSNLPFSFAFDFTRKQVDSSWIVGWSHFFSIGNQVASNKARKINTQVALSMGKLPPAPGTTPPEMFRILSSRNLVRGMALGLASGQAIAKKMGQKPLSEMDLLKNPYPNPTQDQQNSHKVITDLLQEDGKILLKQTPLWYYILKEAEVLHDGNQLGPVGGRIVGDVFFRILKDDPKSIFNNPAWLPKHGLVSTDPKNYRIIDMLRFAGMTNIPTAQ